MPAVCTARWVMFLSGHPHTFCSWWGWISAVWRGDCFGGSLTYWPLERTLGGRPARDPAPGVFLRKSAGGRLGHANLVQRLKAGKPFCPTQRRYSTLWVCPTRCAHQRCHSLTRHWYWASGGNTWAHRERPPAPPTRSAGNRDRFNILNVGECDVHSDGQVGFLVQKHHKI